MIRCPECYNPTCNSGFGKDGECLVCNLAYQYSNFAFEHKLYPKTPKEVKKLNKEIIKKDGNLKQNYEFPKRKTTKREEKLLKAIYGDFKPIKSVK